MRKITIIVLLLISLSARAPLHMFDYWGHAVLHADRPLVIGSNRDASTLFNSLLGVPENAVGYLNVATALPDWLYLSMNSSGEQESIMKTRLFEAMAVNSSEGIEFNGRVILILHGGKTGTLSSMVAGPDGITKVSTPLLNAEYVGYIFGQYLLKLKLAVKQIDIVCCRGGKILSGFARGIKSAGLDDIKMTSFPGEVLKIGVHKTDFQVSIRVDSEGTSYAIPVTSYVLEDGASPIIPEGKMITEVLGNPEAVTPPFNSIVEGMRCTK